MAKCIVSKYPHDSDLSTFFRLIENEEDEENVKLQQCWVDLLHAIKCIYRDNKKALSQNGGTVDKHKCKNHVSRWVNVK